MEKIVLVGGGGHCKVIIDIIKSMRKYEIIAITDTKGIGDKILDIPIIGTDEVLPQVFKGGVRNAFVSLGGLNDMSLRDKIYYNLRNIGYEIPKLIHNKAIVSPYAKVEDGTCVMAGAVINAGAVVQENCIVNTSSVIEHDCLVGRNSHISPSACLAGGVKIGNNSHVGMGASVIQGINIGNNVVIGAGSVVLNNIEDNATAVGIPAKIIKCR